MSGVFTGCSFSNGVTKSSTDRNQCLICYGDFLVLGGVTSFTLASLFGVSGVYFLPLTLKEVDPKKMRPTRKKLRRRELRWNRQINLSLNLPKI